MSEQNRTTLKGYLEIGDYPTEAQFINLIDSSPNFLDDFATKYVKTSVSSAEILAIYTTPKTLVAAPGAGKVLIVVAAICKYTYSTAVYATNTEVGIYHDGGNVLMVWDGTGPGEGIISFSSNKLRIELFDNANLTENAALELTEPTGDPTAGSGILTIYTWYKIVTL